MLSQRRRKRGGGRGGAAPPPNMKSGGGAKVSLSRYDHFLERRVRTLALEEVDPVAPQVNRVHEERSSSLDVDELNELCQKVDQIVGQHKYG